MLDMAIYKAVCARIRLKSGINSSATSYKISNFDADLGLCPMNFFNILKGQDLFEVAQGVVMPVIPSTISGFRK